MSSQLNCSSPTIVSTIMVAILEVNFFSRSNLINILFKYSRDSETSGVVSVCYKELTIFTKSRSRKSMSLEFNLLACHHCCPWHTPVMQFLSLIHIYVKLNLSSRYAPSKNTNHSTLHKLHLGCTFKWH